LRSGLLTIVRLIALFEARNRVSFEFLEFPPVISAFLSPLQSVFASFDVSPSCICWNGAHAELTGHLGAAFCVCVRVCLMFASCDAS